MKGLFLVLSCELHQVGLDEFVDISVHNGGDIRGLVACAVVLHAAIIKDVATDLGTPFDFLLTSLDLGLRLAAALKLLVIELRA